MSMLGVFTFSASGYPPGEGCFASPALPCSLETLPVPLAAETQGAELTSKLKHTLTVPQICPLFVFFLPLGFFISDVSSVTTKHLLQTG